MDGDRHHLGSAPAGDVGPVAGMLRSAQSLLASTLEIAQTRIELLATEVEEEWLRIAMLFAIGLAGLFCVGVATILVVALVVAAFWETHRLLTIGLLALLFSCGGALLLRAMVIRYRAKPRLFAASLDELSKDRQHLALSEW